jgi:hypothetical protein
MKKHFGFSIKVGFNSQWVFKRPWVDLFRFERFDTIMIQIACLGINVELHWWRAER